MTRFQASIVLLVLAVHWISSSNGFFNWKLSRKVSQNTKEIDQLEDRMIEYETKTKKLEIKLEEMTEKGELDQLWEKYKTKFEKQYEKGEEGIKRAVWESNYHKIQQHNADYEKGLVSYTLGENDFTDLTVEEFSKRLRSAKYLKKFEELDNFVPPTVSARMLYAPISYRGTGFVQPVLDQGIGLTCWAFAATGLLESYLYKTTQQSTALSVRQIVDGTYNFNYDTIGYPIDALKYIEQNQYKIAKAQDHFPYDPQRPHAPTTAPINNQIQLKPYDIQCVYSYDDTEKNKDWMQHMLRYSPIAGAIDVSDPALQHYSTDPNIIYENCNSVRGNNHAVLITGHGILDGKEYWEVKNSWGKTWGDNGYIKIRKGINMCGIEEYACSIKEKYL